MRMFPTQKAVAIRRVYKRNWRCGERPEIINLGSVLFPIGEGIEAADALIRKQFPDATDSRLYDETGALFCSGSMGGALTEFLFWLWLACMFAGSGWIMLRILFGLPIG